MDMAVVRSIRKYSKHGPLKKAALRVSLGLSIISIRTTSSDKSVPFGNVHSERTSWQDLEELKPG